MVTLVIVTIGVLAVGSVLFLLSCRHFRIPFGVISLVAGTLTVFGVVLPAFRSYRGYRVSRLTELNILGHDAVLDNLDRAMASFSRALIAVALGEILAVISASLFTIHRVKLVRSSIFTLSKSPRMVICCVLLAFAGEVIVGRRSIVDSNAIATRGQLAGEGIAQTLVWLWPLAVILTIEQRHLWSRRFVFGVLCASAVALLGDGDRSPFLLLGSYGVLLLVRNVVARGVRMKYVCSLLVAAYLGAVFVSSVPAWRHNVSGNMQNDRSLSDVNSVIVMDPFSSLAEKGMVDTLDGMILVESLERYQELNYSWQRVGDAIGLFVPRALWPDKPTPVSTEISASVLGYGDSGMFLSGPGYIKVILHSSRVEFIVWIGIGMVLALLLEASASGRNGIVAGAYVIYLLIRFWSGGDAFDVFHVLSIAAFAVAVSLISRLRISESSRQV